MELADRRGPSLRLVVCSLAVTPWIDPAATDMLSGLRKDFAAKDMIFTISEAHSNAKDLLRSAGILAELGGENLERYYGSSSRRMARTAFHKIEERPRPIAVAFRELGTPQ